MGRADTFSVHTGREGSSVVEIGRRDVGGEGTDAVAGGPVDHLLAGGPRARIQVGFVPTVCHLVLEITE